MFNIVVGLGLFFVLVSWNWFLEFFIFFDDDIVIYIIGFFFFSFVWVLGVLLICGMKFNKIMGVGFLFLYIFFMVLWLVDILGIIFFEGFNLGFLLGFLGVRVV